MDRGNADRGTLLGHTIDAPWTDDDPDREFLMATEVSLAQLLAQYQAACACAGAATSWHR